jgi:hypothetical protein
MIKYIVVKGFLFTKTSKRRNKGDIVELKDKELEFAQENKCVTRYVESK